MQAFREIETKVAIDKGVINQIEFHVTDQDGKPVSDFGSVLMELYVA